MRVWITRCLQLATAIRTTVARKAVWGGRLLGLWEIKADQEKD